MRTRTTAVLTFIGLTLVASGCVTLKHTPAARFFVLRSLVPPQPPAAEAPAPQGFVAVLPVRIPGALDRSQLVAWTTPNEVRLDEFARWAEPLDEGVTRTLAENLAALLPQRRVLRAPWPGAASPRCRLGTELRVFGPQPNGEVRLEASFALLAPKDERALARGSFASGRTTAAAARANTPDVNVEAMSQLVAELAKQIATAIEVLPAEAATQ
jgi:uncharacterized lipoprotein YmbA